MDGPLQRYRAHVAQGALTSDPTQQVALEKLQIMWRRLEDGKRDKKPTSSRGFFSFGRKTTKPPVVEQGLYMYGGVGRGKSMLMDLFYETATIEPKRRAHFHAFMQEAHALLRKEREKGAPDPLPPVAAQIAEGAKLLCFDEMQVSDIADAMILGRLFEGLFEAGVTVVSTSNRPPEDLYKDGLNRALFLPFIDMLKQRLDVLHLESPTDYRLLGVARGGVYFHPLGPEADDQMDALWRSFTEDAAPEPEDLTVQGRTVRIPAAHGAVGRASFSDLCEKPLGAADYLTLAERYGSFMLDRVPVMSPAKQNEAKRFVTLIDALYEARTRVAISAEVEPTDLYNAGAGSFEFERTASRLIEMRSEGYLSAIATGDKGD